MELPLSFQSYESESLPFSAQRLVNLYWETAPQGAKSQGVLFRRPGLQVFAEVGRGPIRGLHVAQDTLYVVSGDEVYTVDSSGTPTLLTGNIPGFDPVDSDDNGTQVAFVSGNKGYIAEGGTVEEITDVNFRPVSSVTFVDSFFAWTEADSGRFFLSPPLDGKGPYDPLDFATAEFAPDNLVKIISDHGDLFLMGVDTIEPWYNNQNVDFTFQPADGAVSEFGVLSRNTVRKMDSSLFWLGRGERGERVVYRMNGYAPIRISTHALERRWDQVGSPEESYAFSFMVKGHAFYVLTFPDFGTFVYDASTNFWHEWQTNGREDFVGIGFANAHGKRLIGNRRDNQIYEVSVDFFDDAGEPIKWEATTPPVSSASNNISRHSFFRVDIPTGLDDIDGIDPKILIQWADEDGLVFGNKRLVSLGNTGERKTRAYIRQLGRARSRTYRVSGSDPIPLSIIGVYVEASPGQW